MSLATFRVHGELCAFLPRERRGATFAQACARAATLKQAIEAAGVPHTEIGHLTVSAQPASLARTVREGDAVEVFPHEPGGAPFETPLRFLADAHLGGLARMLRMLGLDAAFDPALDDAAIVELASAEHRVVLTRDRALLMRRDVLRGAFVHARKPEEQLREVTRRYAIAEHMRPFALCLHCNLELSPAGPDLVRQYVPERIQTQYRTFMHCAGCGRVYWEGSHWERMRSVLASVLDVPLAHMG